MDLFGLHFYQPQLVLGIFQKYLIFCACTHCLFQNLKQRGHKTNTKTLKPPWIQFRKENNNTFQNTINSLEFYFIFTFNNVNFNSRIY